MKQFVFIVLAVVAAITSACSSEDFAQDSQKTKEVAEIVCLNGTLHFPSGEICLNTMASLTSEENLHAFEKKYNFTSWRTFADGLLDEIIECETPEEYQAVLETCTDYLKEDNGRLMPIIASVGYASIADINGVFYVGDVKHQVHGEFVTVETTDAKTRATHVENIDYIAPVQSGQTRNEISVKYTDRRRETSKYKVFARTNVLRHTAVEQINGKNAYNTSFAVQVHVSGQKKKTLIGWNTYKDRFYVENLHYDLTIAGKRIWFEEYWNKFSQSEYTKNLYVTVPFGTGMFIGTPTEVPMPSGFNCIVHRARSRDMGKCGVVTDINCCKSVPQLPVPECID